MKPRLEKQWLFLISLICTVWMVTGRIYAEEKTLPSGHTLTITLENAVKKALSFSSVVKAGEFRTEKARLLTEEVKAKKIVPHLKLSIKTGIVPEARGDVLYSPDQQTDLEGLGPFYQFELKAIQPLVTFGRLPSAANAAEGAFRAKESEMALNRQEFTLKVIEAYWTLQSAIEGKTVAGKLHKDFKKLEGEVKKRVQEEDSDIDDSTLLEVQTESFGILEIVSKSDALLNWSRRTFNRLMDLDDAEMTVTAEESIPGLPDLCPDMEKAFEQSALQHHQGIEALQAAITALEAKIQLERAQKRPLLYLGAGLKWSYASNRDDQKNPFVYDEFNYFKLGAFLGMDWDLNHKGQNVTIQRLKMEKKALEQDFISVKTLLGVKLKHAIEDVKKNASLFLEAQKSLKTAKNWLRLNLDNWDMGLGNNESMIKAYKAYYQLKGKVIQYRYLTNISIAQLAFEMGDLELYLKWVKNEKITIN